MKMTKKIYNNNNSVKNLMIMIQVTVLNMKIINKMMRIFIKILMKIIIICLNKKIKIMMKINIFVNIIIIYKILKNKKFII